jgi:hypothetical protein
MQASDELEELRIGLERIRSLLENLVVRGLRTCGENELSQIGSFAEHLEQTGAGHLASLLAALKTQIERDERTSARTLLETQTNVRLLERLLTLRTVRARYAAALEAGQFAEVGDEQADEEGEE